ncbi:MAG: hypothetical protein AMR96_02505 [Candidatus Adiutrix intracellularis]|nr:MAG: hypothetical protein AMR96_02505 [Candidatus Adiutrix intracellularis]
MRVTEHKTDRRPTGEKTNHSTDDLSPILWADIEARPAAEIAANSGASLVPPDIFILHFMGSDYRINLPARSFSSPPDRLPPNFQTGLVLLTYLIHAQSNLGLAGHMVTSRELKGGEMFFKGPHALTTDPVTKRFGSNPTGFTTRAGTMGLAPEVLGSGTAVRGLILPKIAIGLILHQADEEFPAELTYTFDAYTHYHLPLDGLWAMINVLAAELAA